MAALGGEAKRISHVEESFERLERAVKKMDELSARYQTRYEPIIRNEPTLGKESAKTVQDMVPLASRISGIARTLDEIGDRFDSMLNRTEL